MTPRGGAALLVAGAMAAAGCGEPTSAGVSSLAISTVTSGPGADPDGYLVRVDGRIGRRMADLDSTVVLVAGSATHEVRLSEVAGNCALSGDSVRTVPATPGDTARVSFAVTCGATTGTLRVTTATTGAEIDPNGYRIVIDGAPEPSRADASGVYSTDVPSGHHTVALGDLTANCGPGGAPGTGLSREVDIGSGTTADVAFTVACTPAAPAGVGHELAFVTDRPPSDGNAPERVYVMNDDGTGLRPNRGLQDGIIFALRWLPDGATLSFLSQPKDEDISLSALSTLVVATGAIDTLRGVHEFDAPVWSPDGTLLAYTDSDVEEFGPAQVWVAAGGSGQGRQISSNAVAHWSPTWSPDGTRLAYAGRGGNDEVDSTQILVRALGGGPETVVLAGFPGRIKGLAWSPDGSRFAFTGTLDPRLDPLEVPQIYTAGVNGGQATALTGGELANSQPSWSPDGARIAFTSERDGNAEIYVMNADGSEQTRVTNDPGVDATPAWRP